MKDKDLLNLLKKNGLEVKPKHWSHHIMQTDGKNETNPNHVKDVPTGLLNAILKRTGLK